MLIKILMSSIVFLGMCASCVAHTLTVSEMMVGGVGIGCNLGYVRSVYGEPADKKYFNGDGVRAVNYIYGPNFNITGRTSLSDKRSEEELMVVGFTILDGSLATPSGIKVGDPISKVTSKFGNVLRTIEDKRVLYTYDDQSSTITFYIDKDSNISKIYVGTDW